MSRVTEMYSEMIFKFGFIHCDPHPGNVLIQKGKSGPRVILLDHGLYESTSDEFRYHYALLWKSIIKGDLPKIRLAARFLNVEDFFPPGFGNSLAHIPLFNNRIRLKLWQKMIAEFPSRFRTLILASIRDGFGTQLAKCQTRT